MTRICFLMPFSNGAIPSGGLKIVLQYANELVKDGYIAMVCYPYIIFEQYSFLNKLRYIYHHFNDLNNDLFKWRDSSGWLNKDKRVIEKRVWSLNACNIPKSDIYIATGIGTSRYVKDYPSDRLFYFIQDFEDWGITADQVKATYKYPLAKFCVSTWLQRIVESTGEKCCFIPNGFNLNEFGLIKPIRERNRYTIGMLYHWAEHKDIPTGLRALEIVHKKYP